LYLFLAWTLWVLWRDLRASSRDPALALRTAAPLELLDHRSEECHRFTIPRVVLGRDPSCEYQVEDSTVSARHARFSYHHEQWWVQDLGSRNGTFLNRAPVSEPAALAEGDELRCGQLVFKIRLAKSTHDGARISPYNDSDLA
jgi:predicted component of type VI protein secretion system